MIAFWRYSYYPYCLWGKVEKIDAERDRVYVESYRGYFKPFIILPEEEATDVINRLTELKESRARELKRIEHSYDREAINAFPSLDHILNTKI